MYPGSEKTVRTETIHPTTVIMHIYNKNLAVARMCDRTMQYKMAAVRHIFLHLYPTMSFYMSRAIIGLNLKSVARTVPKLQHIEQI